MSVSGHFVPKHPHLWVPKPQDGADPIGIKCSGGVLEGNLYTSGAFALDRIAAVTRSSHHSGPNLPEIHRILSLNRKQG